MFIAIELGNHLDFRLVCLNYVDDGCCPQFIKTRKHDPYCPHDDESFFISGNGSFYQNGNLPKNLNITVMSDAVVSECPSAQYGTFSKYMLDQIKCFCFYTHTESKPKRQRTLDAFNFAKIKNDNKKRKTIIKKVGQVNQPKTSQIPTRKRKKNQPQSKQLDKAINASSKIKKKANNSNKKRKGNKSKSNNVIANDPLTDFDALLNFTDKLKK